MKRILVVEDNPVNLELIRQLLEDDYEVIDASDGEQGVERAIESIPDLVLMDLRLPKVDGWKAFETLRERADTAKIPVIAVTAYAVKGDRERILEAGFDAYLSKPVDEDLLVETIARLLSG